jgi:hypothetical protein
MAQISNASVDQYLTQVGEDASTTSQGIRESRSEGPDSLVTPDTSSDTYSDAANTPSASMSGTTSDTPTALLGASATTTIDDVEAGGGQQAANIRSLPETGGLDSTAFLWGFIALASLLPCLSIARTAATSANDPG